MPPNPNLLPRTRPTGLQLPTATSSRISRLRPVLHPRSVPSGDFALIEDDTDVAMAAFCFLTEIERLVNYVEEAWKSCAVLTTESVELVKTLEEGLIPSAGRG